MKKILIYGDSNTWGDNLITGIRLGDNLIWANILQKKLGSDFKVIGEGLPGRVAGNYKKDQPFKNGMSTFISTFRTWAPIDIIIIALGTNDLQVKYNRSSNDIINDLLWYRDTIIDQFSDPDNKFKYFNNKLPRIIYLLPPKFSIHDVFSNNSEEKRLELINIKNKVDEVIQLDELPLVDGIHLNSDGHKMVADVIYNYLNK